jgi:PUB domain/UBX domain
MMILCIRFQREMISFDIALRIIRVVVLSFYESVCTKCKENVALSCQTTDLDRRYPRVLMTSIGFHFSPARSGNGTDYYEYRQHNERKHRNCADRKSVQESRLWHIHYQNYTFKMFRKLQDRVAAAASSLGITTANTDRSSQVQRLRALSNCTIAEAEAALNSADGNVDRAAELLLSQSVGNARVAEADDMDLQRALQASLESSGAPPMNHRTAAMHQAAQAAIRRQESSTVRKTQKSSTTTNRSLPPVKAMAAPIRTKSDILRQHHPDVKLIPKLQDKAIEEQVLRTVDRMKSHAAAVDTLHRALTVIYQNPSDSKYRRVDTAHSGYQRAVAGAPGTQDFLRAMKFFPQGSVLILSEQMYDHALIYLGLTALEQAKQSPEYMSAKTQLVFQKEVASLLETKVTPEEMSRRNQYRSNCPKEPSEGTLLQVHLIDGHTIRRRFDSDDTVADLLSWIGSQVGSVVYQRVVEERTWTLMDVNHRVPLDVGAVYATLQYVGCWPSGRLQLQPTTTLGPWKPSKLLAARGLASRASSSDDE